MKRLCHWLDRFRDKRLTEAQSRQFQTHLEACENCRTQLILWSNIARAIQKQDIGCLKASSAQIADRAFERSMTWDAILLAWLKPAQALSGLALIMILLSFLWTGALRQQATTANNYEQLFSTNDQDVSIIASLSDAEFENWLQLGGKAK